MAPIPTDSAAQDIKAWAKFFSTAKVPVLKHTARQLAALKEDEDNISARSITAAVLHDPMMVFRILSYSQKHKSKSQLKDLVQVEQAVLMMGTGAFYRDISADLVVEDTLKTNLPALMHLLKLIHRSHRAAKYAAEWAAHLNDYHAEEVHVAALLHDFAEILMWCYAPEKMNLIFAKQHADKTLRSKEVQLEVLGFKLCDLQQEIVALFQLPPLLSHLMEEDKINEQRVRNVTLAVNLARHSANGWDDAALPDDYRDVAELLHLDVEKVMHVVGAPVAE